MLIIDAEHLSDGLYNIKNGKIFKYKANGGTVRSYKMNTIEQNLVINPEEVAVGRVIEIGEDIIVMHHKDYYDMFSKSELYDDIKPCEDAISREELIERLEKDPVGRIWVKFNNLGGFIKAIPSVAPSRPKEWIPCSERLPEETGRYLCTVGTPYRNPREMYYAPQEWADKSDDATWRSIDGYVSDWFVVAWMPLPEPWKGADDE